MPESEHTQRDIAAIRTQLDNVERMTRLSIAANPNSQAHVEALLRARAGAPEMYLLMADGPKTPEQLRSLTGKSQATVSKVCSHLFESGLIERQPDPSNSGGIIYRWHEMERTLGVARIARRLVKK